MMSTPIYNHKNVEIAFNQKAARFEAVANGKNLQAPSLDAIKKQIEGTLRVAFRPFKALRFWADELMTFTVSRVDKSNVRREGLVFVTDAKGFGRTHGRVTLDTPDNRALIKEWQDAHKAAQAEIAAINEHVESLRKRIPFVSADDYGVTK